MADLCTLQDVKTAGGFTSTERDEQITAWITQASSLIDDYCSPRQFAKDSAASARVYPGVLVDDELDIDDLSASPTLVELIDADGSVIAAIESADVVTHPRNRRSWTPIRRLSFRPAAASVTGYDVRVTGVWGWPVVPPVVVAAAVETVRDWLRWTQDTNTHDPGDSGYAGRELPGKAKLMLGPLRGVRIG